MNCFIILLYLNGNSFEFMHMFAVVTILLIILIFQIIFLNDNDVKSIDVMHCMQPASSQLLFMF